MMHPCWTLIEKVTIANCFCKGTYLHCHLEVSEYAQVRQLTVGHKHPGIRLGCWNTLQSRSPSVQVHQFCDLLKDVLNKLQCICSLTVQAEASVACSNSSHHARSLSPSTIISGSSTTQQSWLAIAHDRSIGCRCSLRPHHTLLLLLQLLLGVKAHTAYVGICLPHRRRCQI